MAGQFVEIHKALAAQLKARHNRPDFNYLAFPDASAGLGDHKIEVWPGSPYVDYWGSFGSGGTMDLNLRLRIETHKGDAQSAGELMCELLSVGDGAQWSVFEAVMADDTLGGTVEECVVGREIDYEVDDETYAHVAWMQLAIIVRKSGAGV